MDWRELNRAMWDERVPLHVQSRLYDVAGFKAGKSSLRAFEEAELGAVAGKELVHLQCHIGLDTLSWARKGARVTGLDFSEPAIASAKRLATEISIDAEFVCADVYEAPEVLGRRFDVVYTGVGALCWLPDIDAWANVIARLMKPGAVFYLVEIHPITEAMADSTLDFQYDYFHDSVGRVLDESGSYADPSAKTRHNRTVEWIHPVGDVVTALASRGLRIESLREHDFMVSLRWPFLEERADGTFHLPGGMSRLPLMYSLKACAPAAGRP
jgi:SAM-dependent methyltransferase